MASQGNNGNKEAGTRAEEYVAEQVDGRRTPNAWFDVEAPGEIIEVKSTQERVGGPKTRERNGRFRLWKSQHQNLVDHNGTYYFLLEGREPVVLDASEVTEILEENDLAWADSGRHPQDTHQVKLVWTYVFERSE